MQDSRRETTMPVDADIGGEGAYVVECEECDIVEFPGGNRTFASLRSADWYAGLHSGTEHPDSDRQMALATSNPETEDDNGT